MEKAFFLCQHFCFSWWHTGWNDLFSQVFPISGVGTDIAFVYCCLGDKELGYLHISQTFKP
ncbi:MAG: hypothetical protein WD426_00080 [Anditalea sp.]